VTVRAAAAPPSVPPVVRRLLLVALLLLGSSGCGDDDGVRPSRTIAFLRAVPNPRPAVEAAFLEELRAAGWVEGENLTVLARDPDQTHPDGAAEAVRGWVDEGVDLIVALSTSGARVADEEAPDVPVLFVVNDPTAAGLVDDERAPEGHLTGVTYRVPADRTLDVAMRTLGSVGVVGLLWPEDDPAAGPVRAHVRTAGRSLDVEVVEAGFTGPEEVAGAVDRLAAAGADAILLANAPATLRAGDAIGEAAARVRIPVVANTVAPEALVVLTPDSEQLYRQLGRQAVRILSGSEVSEVPVEDPGGYRVVLSRAAANRLGIDLPDDVLRIADEVVGA
jgi:putative ABC transport system substrate-binding protein